MIERDSFRSHNAHHTAGAADPSQLCTGQSANGTAAPAKVARRQWTRAEERELADLYDHGHGPQAIAAMMGRTVGGINAKLDYMLVTRKTIYRAWTMPELRRALAMRNGGASFASIARALDRPATSVRNAVLAGAA